jgi:hypothetical protein
MSAERAGSKGEPASKPSGAGAATRLWQQGQTPRWRLMRVTMGRSGGRSMCSQAWISAKSAG